MKSKHKMIAFHVFAAVAGMSIWFLQPAPSFAAGSQGVTVDNFVRAESDHHMIGANIKAFNANIGQLVHVRKSSNQGTSAKHVKKSHQLPQPFPYSKEFKNADSFRS